MKVLVACEFSGRTRDAFIRRGHSCVSVDLLPGEGEFPHHHIQGDALQVMRHGKFDLMIAHPPCTYLCNSGVRWLYEKEGRWELMRQGAEFFKQFLDADIPHICVENPVMHKYAKEIVGQNFSQSIQPWEFGHGEIKRTCLWLKGLPHLKPTNVVPGRLARMHLMAPSPDRGKLRSVTYDGFAEAFADQWSVLD